MSSISVALITFVCIFGGVFLGMALSMLLPGHHLSSDSKDSVKMAAGIVATMAALVLGLLVGSSKSSFDNMNSGITQIGAKVIMLDRTLAHYGPESKDIRDNLRGAIGNVLRHVWPEEKNGEKSLSIVEKSRGLEALQASIKGLSPRTEDQKLQQSQADQLVGDLAQLRWMLIEQQQNQLPTPLLVVLVFWLSMLFTSFGLFAARNITVISALCISAISVSAALFIILEMNTPLDGMIKVSSAPIHKALEHMGK
jgi:hypothetical protein